MEVPMIHLNGSSIQDLREQIVTACDALRAAQEAVGRAAPHMRDYYPYPDGQARFDRAMAEHRVRFFALGELLDEYKQLYRAILKQDARKTQAAAVVVTACEGETAGYDVELEHPGFPSYKQNCRYHEDAVATARAIAARHCISVRDEAS